MLTYLKGTMHKGFIQVDDHADPSLILLCHLWEQAGPRDLKAEAVLRCAHQEASPTVPSAECYKSQAAWRQSQARRTLL